MRDELQAYADLQMHRFEFKFLGLEFVFRLRFAHGAPLTVLKTAFTIL
jgi:hypothetical protein